MSPEELIQQAYEAFNSRNIDGALALMNEDVEWPNGMEGGMVYGPEEIRRYWSRQWGLIDPRVEPIHITQEADDRYRVEVHQLVKDLKGTVIADRTVCHIYRLKNGRIASMEIKE